MQENSIDPPAAPQDHHRTAIPPTPNSRHTFVHREIAAICFLALIVGAVYWPALSHIFAFRDDYRWLAMEVRHDHRYVQFNIAQGRIFNGILVDRLFSRVKHIGDLRYVRGVTLLCLTALGYGVRRALFRGGWSEPIALAGGIIAATLPAAQVYVAWALCAVEPLGGAMGIAAALLVASSMSCAQCAKKAMLLGGGVLTLLAALMIYQPSAMLFWTGVAIELHRPSCRGCRWGPLRRFIQFGVAAGISLALAFVAYKIGMRAYPWVFDALHMEAERSHLIRVSEIGSKLIWFAREPLTDSLNLISIFPRTWIAIGIGAFILIGLALRHEKSPAHRLRNVAIALALLLLSNLPNLVTAARAPGYRTQIAMECIVCFYAMAALAEYWRWLSAARFERASQCLIAILAAAICALIARQHEQTFFVDPQSRELAWITNQLTPDRLPGVTHIDVIPADWDDALAPAVHREFGTPSSAWPPASTAIVELILRQQGLSSIDVRLAKGASAPSKSSLLLDLRQMKPTAQ